jgi:hypothetical protein
MAKTMSFTRPMASMSGNTACFQAPSVWLVFRIGRDSRLLDSKPDHLSLKTLGFFRCGHLSWPRLLACKSNRDVDYNPYEIRKKGGIGSDMLAH